MRYYDDIIGLFVSNYALDYPVEFNGLGCVNVESGVVSETSQPTDEPWLRVTVNGGSTIHASIGTVATKLKREPFDFAVEIFIPRTTMTSSTRYTPYTSVAIEEHLDGFLLVDGWRVADGGTIYTEQSEPKFKSTPQPSAEDTWQRVLITYQYVYQYI